MVMSRQRQPRLKPLLDKLPPGFLADTRWLKAQSIDAKSRHNYVARGWLERVIRGVYRRPLPEGARPSAAGSWETALLSLQWIMQYDVYLGGTSALDLAGYGHFLHPGGMPRVHLYGDVPSWLRRLPGDALMVVHRRRLFGENRTGITAADRNSRESGRAVDMWCRPLKASSPERAVFEALDELTGEIGFEKLDKIFESLTTLRPERIMRLLTICRSVKVRRLFLVFADRHRHAWYRHLNIDSVDVGAGPRALVAGGKLHPTYRIYVPEDFVPTKATWGGMDV